MLDCDIKYNKKELSTLSGFLSTIHKNLIKSSESIDKLTINSDTFDDKREVLIKTDYFPDRIQEYIKTTPNDKYRYSANINNKNIILNIHNFMPKYTAKLLSQYAKTVFIIIHLLSLYTSQSCSKNLYISIYLTPFKRYFPPDREIIGVENVNGGFSNIGCLETTRIIVYREEEWLKVLIHELFHNLNLDFSEMDITRWSNMMIRKFDIKSDFAISETYCEIWARILNVILKSFHREKNSFITNFNRLIKRERIHSLRQAGLILSRFKNPSEYRENSNVFCYYILTAALMNDYINYISWCDTNNNKIFNFKKTEKNVKSFVELLLSESNSDLFKKSLECIGKINTGNERSLCMTII